ncbi:MAG TPA: methyltransferase [Polyangiaceae bacterium]|nr:methyltransferase [Polyangiaceae bacterium]
MERPNVEPPTCSDAPIRQLWLSAYILPTLNAADELGLFPLLEQGPLALQEIAAKLSVTFRGAEAMVATLSAVGLLAPTQGKFQLTELSRNFLLPDKPFYWGHMLKFYTQIPITHEAMMKSLRQDEPSVVNDGKALTDGWGGADVPAEQAALITRAMHSLSFSAAVGLARAIDLRGVKRLLDVAGGSGCCSIAMAQRHPETRFTVADLAPVCAVANEYIARHGASGQVDTTTLDMFRGEWPSGYDAIFFCHILHDWEGARRQHLLRRSFEALPPGGRLFVYEMLLSDAQDGPLTAALFSMCMVHVTLGKQFTAGQLSAEIGDAGFRDVSVEHVYAGYSLLSARKPG